jgi:hypothetical protein
MTAQDRPTIESALRPAHRLVLGIERAALFAGDSNLLSCEERDLYGESLRTALNSVHAQPAWRSSVWVNRIK